MPISAVVITLSDDAVERASAVDTLRRHPRLTLGDRQQLHLPAVIDTETIAEGTELVQDVIPSMEGVVFVHVVNVDFSDVDSFDEKLPPKRRKKRNNR